MAEPRGCIKLELDDSKFSSFVPIIGMYIAGISLVCLLAMFFDIYSAFRHKQKWIPCKLFSLNSLTLTLLAIAAKLPVDLTTPMPSGLDQFSKLSGNAFICVSMAFFMPSVGLKSNHDSVTNLLSVGVFVVTLIVNTCLQIRTGVIFLFIVEHIIIMCCLVSMLCPLLICLWQMSAIKDLTLEHNKDLVREGKGSLLQRLELAYLYGFNHDPPFAINMNFLVNFNATGLCLICSVVLMQAAIRNLSWKFCGGSSDYGWSIWVIVLAQILIVLVGSSATFFRARGFRIDGIGGIKMVGGDNNYPLGKADRSCLTLLMFANPVSVAVLGLLLMNILISFSVFILMVFVQFILTMVCICHKEKKDIDVENYEKLIVDRGGIGLPCWGLFESVKSMKKWMEKHKSQPMKTLADLLVNTQPSQPFHIRRAPQIYLLNDTLQVSSLSLVALVEIAKHSLPSKFCGPLIQAYHEVMEIIHFVDFRMRSKSSMTKIEVELAKAYGLSISQLYGWEPEPEESKFDMTLARRKSNLDVDDIWGKAVLAVIEFIEDGYCRSTQHGAADFIQQLFVDMVYIHLSQLPHAVYKEVTQSTAEGFFKSVKTSSGILWKIELLETHMHTSGVPTIRWSFPEECVCDLITPQNDSPVQITP